MSSQTQTQTPEFYFYARLCLYMCRLKELASRTVRSSERSIAKHAGAPSDATAKTHATRGSEKTTPPSACAASRNARHHPRAANAPSINADAYVKRFAVNIFSPCLLCSNSVIAAAAARSDEAVATSSVFIVCKDAFSWYACMCTGWLHATSRVSARSCVVAILASRAKKSEKSDAATPNANRQTRAAFLAWRSRDATTFSCSSLSKIAPVEDADASSVSANLRRVEPSADAPRPRSAANMGNDERTAGGRVPGLTQSPPAPRRLMDHLESDELAYFFARNDGAVKRRTLFGIRTVSFQVQSRPA